jgi:uncharacterized membrane protein SirB2
MIPAFLTADLLHGFGPSWSSTRISTRIACAFVPVLFVVWCWPVLKGGAVLPTRSLCLLCLTILLSAISLAFGARYGVQYQSVSYVLGVAIINVVFWIVLGILAVSARRSPSFARNLAFHAALFAWIAWCAFPYLGELP